MENIQHTLDAEAAQLFEKLRGIDTSYSRDRLSESLEEEKKREDGRRALLIELVHLLSTYFLNAAINHEAVDRVAGTIAQLAKISPKRRTLLIRYRGFGHGPGVTEEDDYEIIYGNTMVDAAITADMAKRAGPRMADLSGRLRQACSVFSRHDISTLYLRFPGASSQQQSRFFDALCAMSRYPAAAESDAPIAYTNAQGETVSFPLICNENGVPDPNLTLLSVTNRLKPQTARMLVDKIARSAFKERYMSVYNAIFSVKKLQGKLIRPPVEINNAIWLIADREKEVVSPQKAEVARFAIENAAGSPQKAANVLKSVYGNDYEKIDSTNLGERLQLSSGLLDSVQKSPDGRRMEKEILGNIATRIEQVQEKVIDDIFAQKQADPAALDKGTGVFDTIHETLLNLITFYKRKIDTKRKMRRLVHRAINFDLQDFETLAKDFDITVEQAKGLIELLKDCFDENGRFIKGAFARNIPELSRYERKIFEFLWHYLREYIHQKDRTSYLNSLQVLIAKMQRPKGAIKILISDFCKDPQKVNYSDSKALMLCNLIVRKYNKGLIDVEITPEDVLLVEEGLDENVANYSAWKIDRDQNSIFEKIRTIHQNLTEALDSAKASGLPLSSLILLEREAYIFFSLIGGASARSIILSAVKAYGDPESMIYHGKESAKNIMPLLQNLRITVRGLGRIGELEDLPVLDMLKENKERLLLLEKSNRNKVMIDRIMNWAEATYQKVIQKK